VEVDVEFCYLIERYGCDLLRGMLCAFARSSIGNVQAVVATYCWSYVWTNVARYYSASEIDKHDGRNTLSSTVWIRWLHLRELRLLPCLNGKNNRFSGCEAAAVGELKGPRGTRQPKHTASCSWTRCMPASAFMQTYIVGISHPSKTTKAQKAHTDFTEPSWPMGGRRRSR
jgi:hypothetical protein